jgi:cytochrome o ubiquinol oxidase subunit IV
MNQLSLKRYIVKYMIGFGSALILSVIAYVIVVERWFESSALTMAVLLLLAFIQLVVQLVCFLHIGFHKRSLERTVTIIFTMIMMLVIVLGSLWVMYNLDYRMGMNPEAMEEYMIKQNKKGF